ncbi:MAG: VCBS repeat-containing protein [Saprospiraceae bacterium]|nr:VCBS repeat-containing protein [Saprospiraceae bacterium]
MGQEETGINFINKVENTDRFNIFNYRNFYNGGGVAIGDINNDGLSDVFLTSNMGENKLYLNKGAFRFEDISVKAFGSTPKTWSTGVVMVDINADGWLDIYVCNAGYQSGTETANKLYLNNKDLTFTEKAAEYGLDDKGYTTHAAFFDYDKDGDLDAYILNNSFIPVNTLNYSNKRELRAEDWDVREFLKGGGDKLLRNDNGVFKDESAGAGIYGSLIGFGLGISVGDVNNDSWPDIYISNDFFEKDYLYINQKNGRFSEQLEERIGHISMSSMGSDLADINNDGCMDIFATDMLPDEDVRIKRTTSFEGIDVYNLKESKGFYHQYVQNAMQLNKGDGSFTEIANMAGISGSDWSWGALIFDADNDGLQDIIVCNGIYKDVIDQDFIDFFANDVMQRMVLSGKKEKLDTIVGLMPSTPIPNKAYHNLGKLRFKDEAINWGLATPSYSNGAAYGDLDNDGDLDMVVSNVNQPCFVYRNNATSKNNYLSVTLKGIKGNTQAIGGKVTVYTQGRKQVREVMPARGFQSSVDYSLTFGLGKDSLIDSLSVEWPDLRVTSLIKPGINKKINVDQKTAAFKKGIRPFRESTYFKPVELVGLRPHKEDDHIDFYYERGLFEMLSKEGPAYAKADVNGDGLPDIYTGSGKGSRPTFYLSQGKSLRADTTIFPQTEFEDTAAAFFDADNDGDMDLFVGSGGNHSAPLTREMQDRIYINKGKLIFELSTRALPANGMNTSLCLPFDYDKDGDLDLFVGSRSYPLKYGEPPVNYLYKNNGKGFFDSVGDSVCPELVSAGFVTSAVLVDIDGDLTNELVLATTWGKIRIFRTEKGGIKEVKNAIDGALTGMWSYVGAFDLDNDGDQDLLCGNQGTNSYLSAHPLSQWVGDFDENKTIDKILTRNIKGKDLPVMMKREFMEQLPSLKKNNLKHAEYATKTIEELVGQKALSKGIKWNAAYFQSIILVNDGKGKFKPMTLPEEMQISSLSCAAFADLNKDGFTDIIPGGNKSVYLPQFGRLDGFAGDVLLNKGGNSFEWVPPYKSGLDLRGEAKHLDLYLSGKTYYLWALMNNDKPRIFELLSK